MTTTYWVQTPNGIWTYFTSASAAWLYAVATIGCLHEVSIYQRKTYWTQLRVEVL